MCLRKIIFLFLILKLSQCPVTCYKNHSALSAIVFTNIDPPDDNVHSEYYFGKCALSQNRVLLAHQKWTYKELAGKMILRSWLNINQIPTCVYIRTKSTYADLVRYHAYKFNVCICVVVYNYGSFKYTYVFYEWYIPVEMFKDIQWDLFFYLT